jgi:hypothetical protein
VYADFVKPDKAGWKVTVNQIEQGAKIWADYQSIRAAAGTGSAPVYDPQGNITGYKQATKLEEAKMVGSGSTFGPTYSKEA